MLDFQLFRIKVFPSLQGKLFEKEKKPTEILEETVFSLPSVELSHSLIWHLGNVAKIDNTGLYFRIGRTSKLTRGVYQNGQFEDQEFEDSPYTHAILDTQLEVCGIAKKTKLSPTTMGISNQFIRLLQKSEKAKEHEAKFEIGDINDPEDFVAYLKQAYSISAFWINFSRPNAFDVNKDFVDPMQKMLNVSKGNRGKTEIKGENLDPNNLEILAQSAAATGDDAGALIRINEKSKKIRKRLKGNPAIIHQEDLVDENQMNKLLQKLREVYQKIRGKNSQGEN